MRNNHCPTYGHRSRNLVRHHEITITMREPRYLMIFVHCTNLLVLLAQNPCAYETLPNTRHSGSALERSCTIGGRQRKLLGRRDTSIYPPLCWQLLDESWKTLGCSPASREGQQSIISQFHSHTQVPMFFSSLPVQDVVP
jgi:hypothetical protein